MIAKPWQEGRRVWALVGLLCNGGGGPPGLLIAGKHPETPRRRLGEGLLVGPPEKFGKGGGWELTLVFMCHGHNWTHAMKVSWGVVVRGVIPSSRRVWGCEGLNCLGVNGGGNQPAPFGFPPCCLEVLGMI